MQNAGLISKTQSPNDYVVVAASATAAALSVTVSGAAKGNLLKRLIIIPATVAAGNVSLIDGTGSDKVTIPVFVAGTLPSLAPIVLNLDIVSTKNGGWHVATGAHESVLAVGLFT